MSILNQLATALNRRDEEPNEQLALYLVTASQTEDVREDIQELVDNLQHEQKGIRSDCIKVLYEIGAKKPELIEDYVEEFLAILMHKDNRLVWGAMTALGSIAARKPHAIWRHIETVITTTRSGSVITQDWGVRVLTTVSVADTKYATRIYPFLLEYLQACRPKDVPRHAESILIAATSPNQRDQLITILEAHKPQLNPSQVKRVERVIEQVN